MFALFPTLMQFGRGEIWMRDESQILGSAGLYNVAMDKAAARDVAGTSLFDMNFPMRRSS